MPEFDHDPVEGPLRALRDLAAAGHAHARGLPIEQVRALGTRRHRRRMAGTVAATSVAVVLFVGGAFGAAGRLTSTPPPGPASTGATKAPSRPTASPGAAPVEAAQDPTTSRAHVEHSARRKPADADARAGRPRHLQPDRSPLVAGPPEESAPGHGPGPAARPPETTPTLPRSVLLQAAQTWYNQAGDFQASSTVHGPGDVPVSVCQRGSLAKLGVVAMWRRDFVFRDAGGPLLRSAALQFADAQTASAAYRTLQAWAGECEATVRSRGYDSFVDNGQWYDVDSGEGSAQFRSGMQFGPVDGDTTGEMTYFEDQAVAVVGSRVMFMSLLVAGQDHNWAYSEGDSQQSGVPLHPMFHMLPTAAHQLAG